MGSDSGGQQRLMSIAECCVGDQGSLVPSNSFGKPFRTLSSEDILEAKRRSRQRCFRWSYSNFSRRNVRDQRSGGTIDNYLAQIVEKFAGTVLCGLEVKQLRILINKSCADDFIDELGMIEDVEDERDVCLNATDSELSQRSSQLTAGILK